MVQKIIFKISKFLYYKFAYKLENEERRINNLLIIKNNFEQKCKIENEALISLKFLFNGLSLNCFDIGGANDLQPHWKKIQEFATFYIFEPDLRSYNELKSKNQNNNNFKFYNCALGQFNETRPFYLYNEKTGSTMYKFKKNHIPDYSNKYIYPINEIKIKTISLDSFINEHEINYIDVIKLDVQGAELEILKGLSDENIWNKIFCVELEVNFQDVYEGSSTFEEVKSFFVEKDFVLFDLRICRTFDFNIETKNQLFEKYFNTLNPIPSISAKIWEADNIYIRDLNWVLKNIVEIVELKKYLIILITYNFYYDAIKTIIEWFKLNSENYEIKDELLSSVLKIHNSNRVNLTNFENYLSSVDYKIWAQYMEVNFPNN